jgi:hypothetical protein
MQLAVTFGAGEFQPRNGGPSHPSLFVRFDAHVAGIDVRYYAEGWKRSEEPGGDGVTWSRCLYLDSEGADEELEALVREVEAVFGITPSFALFPPAARAS